MLWQDVLNDKSLQDLPYKIELNKKGNIEMSPASLKHSVLQGEIAWLLRNELKGVVFTELAIQTHNGVRVPDVAWGSHAFLEQHKNELYASAAPEICVEIMSPLNSDIEIQEKVALFLTAGASEVWIVGDNGESHKIRVFNQNGELQNSSYPIDIQSLHLKI